MPGSFEIWGDIRKVLLCRLLQKRIGRYSTGQDDKARLAIVSSEYVVG